MPAKNSVKTYVEGGYYHLYNRGVEKRDIFLDKEDYTTFLNLLDIYLSQQPIKGSDPFSKYFNRKNLFGEIELIAYCLMPNHFHLLVRQNVRDGITKLMRNVNTNYVTYFNKKYDRVGSLFQGKFKAVLIESDIYLIHLSRYIHLNPKDIDEEYKSYKYSSYLDYLGYRRTGWLMPMMVLGYFSNDNQEKSKYYFSYRSFVEDFVGDPKVVLDNLVIETV